MDGNTELSEIQRRLILVNHAYCSLNAENENPDDT
jgi:hypothetical protein